MPFALHQMRDLPDERGVFVLWRRDLPIAVHATAPGVGLKAALESELVFEGSGSGQRPDTFSYELTEDPQKRAFDLIVELGTRGIDLPGS